ncbi:hypothetical protein ACHAW5_007270 [Stephanodiscus triporus]|uniref:Sugar phosphate transporter domain-containing protein n=1 Tax=Stephanodiscus triporus TaxID=2934178 RepID=A0ABD3P1E8_9STRA
MTSTHENHGNSKSTTLSFILLFFMSMIGHELALESLSTSYNSFPHLATTITIFQFGFCVLLPLLVSRVCSGGDAIKSFPKSLQELWIYVKLSAIVYGATAFATMSLTYEGVTYVTKVVFKSAKLIPTMIVGVVMDARAERSGVMIKKRKYGALEYVSAFLLCLGAAGFCMSPKDFEGGEDDETKVQESIKGQVNMDGHWIGIFLLAVSVFCDALVPNLQQQLMQGIGCATSAPRKSSEDEEMEMKSLVDDEAGSQTLAKHQQVANGLSPQALMVNTNSIGFTLLLLSTIFRRSFLPIISFAVNNPHFLLMNLIVGIGLGTAVLAYTELIRRSGPAVAVAVATLRKVVTVVLSYIIFPKPMTGVHLVSAVLVMGGIILGYAGPGKK